MTIVRALLPAFILTFVVAAIVAATGTCGGVLAIEQAPLVDWHFYWSWPLFLLFTGIGWGLLTLMR
jgi:hypothetical protein